MQAQDSTLDHVNARSLAGFALFSAAWAVYTLMHQALTYGMWLQFEDPLKLAINAAVACAAVLALGRPNAMWRFVLMLLATAGLKIWQMPYLANHLFFTLVATLSMLLCIGYRALVPSFKAGASKPLNAAAFDLFAPILRLEILALYFWVVIHKLNWDYLNPDVSCGWALYLGVIDFMDSRFGIAMPTYPWLAWPGIIGALLAEAVIPLLLAFQKTRKAGLLLGILFHLMLSFHANVFIASFSLMLYSIYILFLPSSAWAGIADGWKRSLVGRWFAAGGWRMTGVIVFAMLVYSGVIAVITALNGPIGKKQIIDTLHLYSGQVVFITWLCLAGLCLFVFLRWCRSAWSNTDRGWARVPVPLLYALPLLVLVNGVSPYIGLKTHHAFAMFSNLRTEARQTNHLFIPVSLRVVPYQDQEVTVLKSDMVRIPASPEGERMTLFELKRLIHQAKPGTSVTFKIGDEEPRTVKAEEVGDIDRLALPKYWLLKTQLYKAIPSDNDPCPCRH